MMGMMRFMAMPETTNCSATPVKIFCMADRAVICSSRVPGVVNQLFGDEGDDHLIGSDEGADDPNLLDTTFFGDILSAAPATIRSSAPAAPTSSTATRETTGSTPASAGIWSVAEQVAT